MNENVLLVAAAGNSGLDIAAPGVNIESTCTTTRDTPLCTGSEPYNKITGTSMAAPFVTEGASQIWERNLECKGTVRVRKKEWMLSRATKWSTELIKCPHNII